MLEVIRDLHAPQMTEHGDLARLAAGDSPLAAAESPVALSPEPREQWINLAINCLLIALAFSLPLFRRFVSTLAPLLVILWLLEGRLSEKLRVVLKIGPAVAVIAFIGLNLLSLLWSASPLEGFDYVGKYRYFLLIPVIATSLRPRPHKT
jgi:hypothetical protein